MVGGLAVKSLAVLSTQLKLYHTFRILIYNTSLYFQRSPHCSDAADQRGQRHKLYTILHNGTTHYTDETNTATK